MPLELRGAKDMAELAKRMKDAGRGKLRRELVTGIRNEVKPLVVHQKSLVKSLTGVPRDWKSDAARMTRVKVSTSVKKASVRVSIGGGQKAHYAFLLNKGTWRHPLYGNREFWFIQQVDKPGWFDQPARAATPHIVRRISIVVDQFTKRLEG